MNINILDLQFFQEMHDRRYHTDVYHLPLMRRVSHLHNHLTKYSATPNRMLSSYSDALACMLSISNALNVDLAKEMSKWSGQNVSTLIDVPLMYRKTQLQNQLDMCIGKIAKIVEGGDHVETIDYRGELKETLIELFIVWSGIRVDIDELSLREWSIEYVKHIFELKKKSIFFAHIHHDDTMTTPLYRSFYKYSTSL
ncbi:conserved hypothetical protein [Acinetobacter phage Ac42]|uniref:hypothetical protein n=1 Tax=Acinetobacter phage Ac42 TaxID=762660 RepID=UPI0001EBCC74|nr:hypothetical protein Ac42p018 [Acinetobacter phage Ac42]ADI96256.1 conserved hypothetical protein [Acinetobacter phage Ac42]